MSPELLYLIIGFIAGFCTTVGLAMFVGARMELEKIRAKARAHDKEMERLFPNRPDFLEEEDR